MEMRGSERIAASREVVWAALNDPDMLRRCIPGCQELERLGENELAALAVIKVGPISARFQGMVTLSDIDPPNGYRISGEGQGGVAGHARGSAAVRLEMDGDDATILTYEVSAQIGGKLAQLGARMIDATARTMAGAFFRKFGQEILREQAPVAAPGTSQLAGPALAAAGAVPGSPVAGPRRTVWLLAGLVIGAGVYAAAQAAATGSVGAVEVMLAAIGGYVAARLGGLGITVPATVIVQQAPLVGAISAPQRD